MTTKLNIAVSTKNKIINRGTGAGGVNTNNNGSVFERITSIENKLLENKFEKVITNDKNKYSYYFESKNQNNKIIYLTQNGFKEYIKKKFNIDSYRCPDEAFLIFSNNMYHLKILEKKYQNGPGSVIDKLKTGQFTKREYEKIFKKGNDINCKVSYAFCISKYLQTEFESNKPKYNNMKEIMMEDNIKLFYGEDDNYLDLLYEWINKF